jgi:hypothetical protein
MDMKKTFKKYFISHKANNYHAHLLHTKRAIFYSFVFVLTKGILFAFVLFLPVGVFVLPDVLAEEQRQIRALTNQLRQDKKLAILSEANKLDLSAQNKAEDMATNNYFAHSIDNKSLSTWLQGVGYKYEVAGENLAVGFNSAEDILAAWQKSPTHYANLIDPDFKDLGIGLAGGIYKDQPTVFIAQHFAAPVAVAKEVSVRKIVGNKSLVVEAKTKPLSEVAVIENGPVPSSSVLAGKIKNENQTQEPLISANQSSPVDKYIQARNVLSPVTNIFAVSKNIYLAALIFFAIVLLLNIAVHIRKQHYHIIVQTSGLIALLFIFWKF